MNTRIIFACARNFATVSEGGLVTASSAESTAPASNLQTIRMFKRWRSSSADEAWVQWERADGASAGVRYAGLEGINSAAAGGQEWRVTVSSGTSTTSHNSPILDSGWTDLSYPPGSFGFGELDWGTFPLFPQIGGEPARSVMFPMLETLTGGERILKTYSARSVRIWLRGDQPAGYWEARHMLVGMAFQPPVHFQWGRELGDEDLSQVDRGDFGALHVVDRGLLRTQSLSVDHLIPASAYADLLALSRTVGTVRPFIVIPEADQGAFYQRAEAGLYRLASPIGMTEGKANRWSVPVQLEEWK